MYTISKKGRTSKGFRALCNLVKLRLEKIFNKLISLRLVDLRFVKTFNVRYH